MTYPEKLSYLRSYRESLRRERVLMEQVAQLRDEAGRLTQALTGMPGSHSSGSGALPRAVERILAAQQELDAEALRCQALRAQVQATVDALPDPLQRDILTRRYLLGQRWERIAADNNFTLRRVLQLHRSAVDALPL